MSDQLALLPGYLTAHLQLTLVALAIGTAISIPLGIWVTRRRALEGSVLGVASVIQTIPSLALLAIMVPLLAGLAAVVAGIGIELRSIGYLPAIVALTLYSILPILRNTVTGISGVDPALVEAARGVGMTDAQQLRRVELPLALPVIVAGLRTAAVWVVGTATLSTPVGATSLGNFIFSGLQTRNETAVLVGCVAAALLALFLDQLIRLLEIGLRERRRALVSLTAGLLALLYAGTGAAFVAERLGEAPLRIGAKTFTEQYVLSELMAQWISEETGQPTESVQSLGSTVLFDALVAGDIDVYIDYSGTIWATVMKRPGLPGDRESVLAEVDAWLASERNVELAAALGFQNTYALGMRGEQARSLGIRRISDLRSASPGLEIGGDYEFFQRNEWKALVERYGLAFRNERSMDSALMYQAVAAGEVDVISAYSTDGRIAALELTLLEDDRAVIPPYDAIILLRPGFAADHPAAAEALRALAGRIDERAMQELNYAVDEGGRSPADVAREALATLRDED